MVSSVERPQYVARLQLRKRLKGPASPALAFILVCLCASRNTLAVAPSCIDPIFYLFFATLFCFAQRLRCASAIFFLPAADMVLFCGAVGSVDARGCAPRLVEALPARRERADCRRAISASMAERMSRVFICVRYQRSGFVASYVFGLHPNVKMKRTLWLKPEKVALSEQKFGHPN